MLYNLLAGQSSPLYLSQESCLPAPQAVKRKDLFEALTCAVPTGTFRLGRQYMNVF